ncbi:dihydroneopterin aldolase [Indiicoccus explosivorum]|uniref:dihydroneopterin aldolase n=1 Tax=Indiicoccus explosivorum TaxID=1917864 RepID=UPI000B43B346|nr:dihydroneopterin aldolase [Indiicoccus explosivorum]
MDRIHITDMEFYGYHGVLPEETKLGQRFRLSVSLSIDLRQAGETDDLEKTVHYGEVYNLCRSIVEGEPKKLIEAVAEKVAAAILENYFIVRSVQVHFEKPDPPIPGHYRSVAVDITRDRP